MHDAQFGMNMMEDDIINDIANGDDGNGHETAGLDL